MIFNFVLSFTILNYYILLKYHSRQTRMQTKIFIADERKDEYQERRQYTNLLMIKELRY